MQKIVIIGSGISALSLTYFLEKKSPFPLSITLLEKNKEVGGQIKTLKTEKAQYELGPRGFRPLGKGKKTLLLAEELGLTPIFSLPQAKKRFLADEKKLFSLNPWYLLKKGLLPSLLLEWTKKPSSFSDESIASFFFKTFRKDLCRRADHSPLSWYFCRRSSLSFDASLLSLSLAARKKLLSYPSFLPKKRKSPCPLLF